jgi:Bacterial Ig-like domain (group 3).
MKVSKNITIDLNNPRRHVVHLMESGNQREIILTLLKDGMPFDVSEGIGTATLVKGVGYIKANGVPGYYDWTSTDMAAVEAVSGSTNKWTVRLDEHATDVPGFAQIFVKFSLASGETLYSFPITLDVIRTSGGTTDPDKPYYHSTSFLLAGAQAAKTPAMTFPVGVDGDGKLWAEGGWSAEAKEALIACFEQVAWKTTYGQTYLSALETALYPEVYLVSITADYEQDRPIYTDDSLDLVRLDLVVTANYSDGTTETLADDAYELTGTLTAGTSTITVSYGGKTATVSVLVTAPLYSVADFAEQTLTSGGKSITVKKENGVFTISGTYNGVVYINSSGVASLTRPTTAWLSTLSGKALLLKVKDITWANPTSTAISFDTKLSRSDADGSIYSASFAMSANESGSAGETQYAPSSGTITTGRSISALVLQFNNNPGSSASVSASFKVELYVDNVRYL